MIRLSFAGGVVEHRGELDTKIRVGIELSRERRALVGFEVETL